MGEDILFENIMDELNDIHNKYPDLKFTSLIQTAVDRYKRSNNFNLHDLNSKNLLTALQEFNGKTNADRTPKRLKIKRGIKSIWKGENLKKKRILKKSNTKN